MTHEQLLNQLHGLIRERLFGTARWLQDRETNVALHKQLLDWGLIKHHHDIDAFSDTELGQELNLDLLELFLGHHEPWEISDALAELGLVSREEADAMIFTRLEQNGEQPESVLAPVIRRLYLEHFGAA